jgi:hypothetical protein
LCESSLVSTVTPLPYRKSGDCTKRLPLSGLLKSVDKEEESTMVDLVWESFVELKNASGCSELASVQHFRGERRRNDGAVQEVEIKVFDGGVNSPVRWSIVATDEDGREVTGNPSADLTDAITTVHWAELG